MSEGITKLTPPSKRFLKRIKLSFTIDELICLRSTHACNSKTKVKGLIKIVTLSMCLFIFHNY